MVARTKVVPPVTPKIIQQHSRHRHLQLALLFGVFLLIVWFSYDLGRSQAPEWVIGDAGEVRPDDSEEKIAALQQERDDLKKQVSGLQQRITDANQALATAQSRIRALQQAAPASSGAATSVATQKPAASASAAEDATPDTSATVDNTLMLTNLSIQPTASENVYRIGFSVMHAGDSSGRVLGTLWIAVNGFTGKRPVRLSLKTLSPKRRSYVKMSFDQQQDVLEEITLPGDFRPKNVLIEAKPYGDKYTGTSVKIDWDV